MPLKVVVADPYPVTREGIKKVISQYTDLEICPDANTREELFTIVQRTRPELVIMETSLKGEDTLDFVKGLKLRKHDVKVMIYTANDDVETVDRYLEQGVNGYLCKTCSLEEFIKAITMVIRHRKYLQEYLSIRLQNRKNDTEKSKVRSLTKREREILSLVSCGMPNKEIAINLGITERTVKNHLSNIFKKIEVADRTQAAVFAIKNHMNLL